MGSLEVNVATSFTPNTRQSNGKVARASAAEELRTMQAMLFLTLWNTEYKILIQDLKVSICSWWLLGFKETHILHILDPPLALLLHNADLTVLYPYPSRLDFALPQ